MPSLLSESLEQASCGYDVMRRMRYATFPSNWYMENIFTSDSGEMNAPAVMVGKGTSTFELL